MGHCIRATRIVGRTTPVDGGRIITTQFGSGGRLGMTSNKKDEREDQKIPLEINRKRDRNALAALVSAERPASLSANGPFG